MSLLEECHTLAVTAGRHDGKASFLSKGNNQLMTNQAQTQTDALMVEVTRKPVAVDTSENTRKSQGNLLR